MNKAQKAVEQAKLDAEKKVLKKLKEIYEQVAKDCTKKIKLYSGKINALLEDWDNLDEVQRSILQSQIYHRKYQILLKQQIDSFLTKLNQKQHETIDQYMKDCYETGYCGSIYDLHSQKVPIISPIDQKQILKAVTINSKVSKKLYGKYVNQLKKDIQSEISRGIATGLSYSVMARNIDSKANVGFNKAMRIARTEGHGVQVQAANDAQHAAKRMGADVVKQWDAALDGRTRDSHRILDGEIRELDEPFSNGMMYPSDPSGGAAEVVNCRCALLQRARWALDDAELKVLQERAGYFGLDKTDNFEDFKQKYLNATKAVKKTVENSGKSSKIVIYKGLGAAAKNYQVKMSGSKQYTKLAENQKIEGKAFAGKGTKTEIRDRFRLESDYFIPADEWTKVSGKGYVIVNGKLRLAELHWYEADGEVYEMKIKRYLDDEG